MYKNDINLNLYKIFYEVAKSESISSTAKKLFITQSSISKSIKKLEEELDTVLFYRNQKGVKLTEKGEELLFYVEESFNNLLIGERSIIESKTLSKGKLSIGVPSQIASFFIFQSITDFHKKYPNIEITIISKGTKELLTLLTRHEIDFIIDTSPIECKMDNVIIKPLKKFDNCFVANTSSIYDIDKIKSINDLENYPLVLPISKTDNRKQLDNVLEKYKVNINNIINIHTSEMIVGAIKEDLGIGYLIYDIVKDNIKNKEFKKINIKEKLPSVIVNLVYIEKYLTVAPKYFIENYLNIHI